MCFFKLIIHLELAAMLVKMLKTIAQAGEDSLNKQFLLTLMRHLSLFVVSKLWQVWRQLCICCCIVLKKTDEKERICDFLFLFSHSPDVFIVYYLEFLFWMAV